MTPALTSEDEPPAVPAMVEDRDQGPAVPAPEAPTGDEPSPPMTTAYPQSHHRLPPIPACRAARYGAATDGTPVDWCEPHVVDVACGRNLRGNR